MPADTPAASPALTIRLFDKALHDRGAFSCGYRPNDNFLRSPLSDNIKDGMVAAYMATAESDTAGLGFYALGAMAVRTDLGPAKWQAARTTDIPAIYIKAVAVRKDHQGKGLGTALLIDAMRRCVDVSRCMGAAAVVLDVFSRRRLRSPLRLLLEAGVPAARRSGQSRSRLNFH